MQEEVDYSPRRIEKCSSVTIFENKSDSFAKGTQSPLYRIKRIVPRRFRSEATTVTASSRRCFVNQLICSLRTKVILNVCKDYISIFIFDSIIKICLFNVNQSNLNTVKIIEVSIYIHTYTLGLQPLFYRTFTEYQLSLLYSCYAK